MAQEEGGTLWASLVHGRPSVEMDRRARDARRSSEARATQAEARARAAAAEHLEAVTSGDAAAAARAAHALAAARAEAARIRDAEFESYRQFAARRRER